MKKVTIKTRTATLEVDKFDPKPTNNWIVAEDEHSKYFIPVNSIDYIRDTKDGQDDKKK